MSRRRLLAASWLPSCLGLLVVACRSEEQSERSTHDGSKSARVASSAPAQLGPRLLYLPDGGDQVHNQGRLESPSQLLNPPGASLGACPAEMVSVRGQFCIDRYEASMVDAQGRPLSPYYPPSQPELLYALRAFGDLGGAVGRVPARPQPPEFSVREDFKPLARSAQGVVPSGYMSGAMAKRACEAAGKRLCSQAEWSTACRGERGAKFPYGESYAEGGCNIFREAHPAVVLFGDASKNHLDPRLNLAEGSGGPLLRRTGATPSCRSSWGQDGAFDMVGNLDEWVESESGAFQGGFYSRATREGCDARITVHPPQYLDYSLGVRCCQ